MAAADDLLKTKMNVIVNYLQKIDKAINLKEESYITVKKEAPITVDKEKLEIEIVDLITELKVVVNDL